MAVVGERELDAVSLRFDRSSIAGEGLVRRRHAAPIPHVVRSRRSDVLAVARRAWEDRARQEYVGVMLMRHFHGLLVDVNAPMDVQEVALTMLLDEQRHTALATDAARALGADGELSFDMDELRVLRRGAPEAELLDLLIGMLAVSEVVALDLLVYATKTLPASSFRDVLRRIAKDEVFHARVGPMLLGSLRGEDAWLPYPGDAAILLAVDRHVALMRTRDVVHETERALFEDPSARAELEALGVPRSEVFREVYANSLGESVPAALEAVGFVPRRASA
jgi:hypothetical protein